MVNVGPVPGYVTASHEQEAAMREHLRQRLGNGVVVIGPDVEYRPARPRDTHWQAPVSAQDAFTLRSVMAAHRAAAQHLAALRVRQAAAARAPVDIGLVGGRLGRVARAESTRQQVEAAEAREAEVRQELAEAHERATGRPLDRPPAPTPARGPGAHPLRRPTDPVEAALVELDSARADEHAARAALIALGNAPGQVNARYARHLRWQAGTALGLGCLASLAAVAGWPVIVVVTAVSLAVAVMALGLYDTTERPRQIAKLTDRLPAASEDHDVAVRRLVAAEAAAVALNLDIVPTTLDADVERAAARPVPLAWDA